MLKRADYYTKNSLFLGWGDGVSLDKERKKLLQKFVVGRDVLDVGCGWGQYVDFLQSLGFNVTGLDITTDFIEFNKKNRHGKFIIGKAENLPFKDKAFDTVCLFDILEHGNDTKILKEAIRVTKMRIIIIVPKKVDKGLEQSGVIFRHYIDKTHIREYEQKDMNALAEKVNVKISFINNIHPLYIETIFLSLFNGPILLKKIIRRLVFSILRKKNYPTEIFAVIDL